MSVVAPDGVSSPAIAPAGDRLAYIRGGKIEVLTFAAGTDHGAVGDARSDAWSLGKDKVRLGDRLTASTRSGLRTGP